MEHRKRHMMQQKTEMSILVRLAAASKKSGKFNYNQNDSKSLFKVLASEAIQSAKICDRATMAVQLSA